MLDYIEYTDAPGNIHERDAEVYALSTCGFCKRGLAFLRENGIAHRYVYIDLLPFEVKTRVKEDLRSKFKEYVSFPYMVLDGEETLIGFTEAEWRKRLLATAKKEKSLSDVEKFTLMVAKKQGWALTPDKAFYKDLTEGLRVNYARYGYFLCPCRDSDGSREADADICCPCVYAKADIERYGHCFCSLYQAPGFIASGARPSGIPDGRATRS